MIYEQILLRFIEICQKNVRNIQWIWLLWEKTRKKCWMSIWWFCIVCMGTQTWDDRLLLHSIYCTHWSEIQIMTEFAAHHAGDLWGSRTLGTHRQLFSVNVNEVDTSEPDNKQLRPAGSRATAGLAQKLSLMDFPAMCSQTINSIDHIEESSMTTQAFKVAYESGPSRPAVIHGCTSRSPWPAGATHWAPEVLKTTLGADMRLEVSQQGKIWWEWEWKWERVPDCYWCFFCSRLLFVCSCYYDVIWSNYNVIWSNHDVM